LTGSNLNYVRQIKLTTSTEQLVFASTSNDREATCDITYTPADTTIADWDVVVVDGRGFVSNPLRGILKF
jgi:hypothetical protein